MKRYAACIIMMLASIAATAQNMGFGTNMGQPHHSATVITRLKAPEWILPIRVADYSDPEVANLSAEVPMLQWMPSCQCCNGCLWWLKAWLWQASPTTCVSCD